MLQELSKKNKIILVVVLVLIAFFSATVVTKYTTSQDSYKTTIKTLNEKKERAMALTAGLSTASIVVAAIPGDSTTPLATQLAELADIMLFIIAILYIELLLAPNIGYLSFMILIPISCGLFICAILLKNYYYQISITKLATKLATFAIIIGFLVPTSVWVSNLVDQTFAGNDEFIIEDIEEFSSSEIQFESQNLANLGSNTAEQIAESEMSKFVNKIAAFFITTCVIPLAVLFFMVWIVKILFGFNIDIPKKPPEIVSKNKNLKKKQEKLNHKQNQEMLPNQIEEP